MQLQRNSTYVNSVVVSFFRPGFRESERSRRGSEQPIHSTDASNDMGMEIRRKRNVNPRKIGWRIFVA